MSTADRNKPPLSLEKLIALVVLLVEKSRNIGGQLELSDNDLYVLQGMKVTFIIKLCLYLKVINIYCVLNNSLIFSGISIHNSTN